MNQSDEEYFCGVLVSLGYELYLCKILYSCFDKTNTKRLEHAKDWLQFSQPQRNKLQYLIDQNRSNLEKLNQGLAIITKILSNIIQSPSNASFRSLKYERNECGFNRKEDFLVSEDLLTKKEAMVFKILIKIVEYFLKGEQDVEKEFLLEQNKKMENSERDRIWQEVWDNRIDDRNSICCCCWKEIIQYKARNTNNAGWYTSSMNDRTGYSYRYSCEECSDFNLCYECHEKWEENKDESIHDQSHSFKSHASENKKIIRRGNPPDPKNYRRKFA